MCVWTRELPTICHPDSASKYSDQPPLFSFFFPRALPPLSCPTQWGRILLVAMTSGQCLYEMQPLTVWPAGQDTDTSRFKEELLPGTAGRNSQTPQTRTLSAGTGPFESQRSSTPASWWGDNTVAVFIVVTRLLGRIQRQRSGRCTCVFSRWMWRETEEARSWASAAAGSRMGCDPWIQLKD